MPLVQIFSLALVILLLIALVLWAIRRHRRLKYQRIKTRLRYQNAEPGDFKEEYGSELPSGGARVVGTRDTEDVETVNARIRQQAEANRPKLSISTRSPSQQASLDLGDEENSSNAEDTGSSESVPLLLDPADDGVAPHQDPVAQSPDLESPQDDLPGQSPDEDYAGLVSEAESESAAEPESPELDSQQRQNLKSAGVQSGEEHFDAGSDEESIDDILFSDPQTVERRRSQEPSQQAAEAGAQPLPEQEAAAGTEREPEPRMRQTGSEPDGQKGAEDEQLAAIAPDPGREDMNAPDAPEQDEPDEADEADSDEVIIINLMVREGNRYFGGQQIRQVLEKQGMKLGQMDIFHYQSDISGRGVRFSAANILNPGTFPPAELDDFETPGICFFMTLNPGYANMEAFSKLMEIARNTAASLGGDLKDQNRSYLTGQRVEHIRSQISDYQRKLLLR